MWNASSYGNTGGIKQEMNTGGGFLNTTSTAVTPGSQEKRKPDRITNVAACTIQQIHQMPDEEEYLKIGSMTVRVITFVGFVRSVDIQSTKISYLIDDFSGPVIEAQIWIVENEDSERRTRNVQENTYVRVTGAVRAFKGKRYVLIFKIAPVADVNEITLHILETIHTSMAIANMDKQQSMGNFGGLDTQNTTQNVIKMEQNTLSEPQMAPSNNQYSVFSGLSKEQQIVLHAITSCTDPQGADVNDLFVNIKSINRQAIMEAVEFLSNEGHVYSTTDEDHYKSTDANS